MIRSRHTMLRPPAPFLSTLFLIALLLHPSHANSQTPAATLSVPAFTAYSEPDMDAIQIEGERTFRGWDAPGKQVVWYGKFTQSGKLSISLKLRVPKDCHELLKITLAQQTLTADVALKGEAPDGIEIKFGEVNIPAPGYQRIALEGVTKSGRTFGVPEALLLSGPAATGARFNLVERQRGAPSVHLTYPVPEGAKVQWFYNEVTAKTDPIWSYYEACGWHRGYFGIQVNSPTERRIIFSVWDAGKEANDRNKVADENRVKLLAKGEGVVANSFGGEGTGGHSHMVYPWKTGDTYKFLVSAEVDGNATIYTGYFYFPEKQKWGLIARFRAPFDGSYMHGLYSFDEDWNPPNGQRKRLAEFGNQWVKTTEGKWIELTDAVFTHTAKDIRSDYDAGVVGKRFYLRGGGFEDGKLKYKDRISRPAGNTPPVDIVLPVIPADTRQK